MNITKIINTPYYNKMFIKSNNVGEIIKAGYFEENIVADYDLNNLCTPFTHLKPLDNKQNVVLVSTGAFSPVHNGHLSMINKAKQILTENDYNVIGSYLSPCNYEYLISKGNTKLKNSERINHLQEKLIETDIKLDLWEYSLADTVNFTTVIDRLEKYLQKHVAKNITVIYVYGMDNVDFYKCFEGIKPSVCVYRETDNIYLEKFNNLIDNPNIYLVEDNEYADLASSKINFEHNQEIKHKDFLIRNEQTSVLDYLNRDFKAEHIEFSHEVKKLFARTTGFNIDLINVSKQQKQAKIDLKNKTTISLDNFYHGDYNLQISRVFEISSYQNKPKYLTNSPYSEKIENQIADIGKLKRATIVDDDSVSGNTLRYIDELLKHIQNKEYYFLAEGLNKHYFDVVDLRDFIIGAEHGGLVVQLNNKLIRVPYINPYVNLKTRASIPQENCLEFSKQILILNKKLYSNNKDIMVSEIKNNELWNYLGYGDSSVYNMILSELDNKYKKYF